MTIARARFVRRQRQIGGYVRDVWRGYDWRRGRSRLHKRNRVLLDPRDLKCCLVEHTATSELNLVLRTVGEELLLECQKISHPLDPRVHDANVRLETVRVEQQAKPASLLGDAGRESDCSTLLVTKKRHPTPRGHSEVPSARPRRRGVPIDQHHRHASPKDGVRREEFVVTDRLNRQPRLEAPLPLRPRERRRGIVVSTDERAEMHENVVTPDEVRETTVEAPPLGRDEAVASPDLSLDVSQNLSPLVVEAQRTRRAGKSFTFEVPQQIVDR